MVVGAGLAGCEAALQCARRGVPVRLFEMRPDRMTEAHETGDVAELVCSNSLKSDEQTNAHGLLKAELRILGSVLLECAERARVPGGKALVVDRRRFSQEVQKALDDAGVAVARKEVTALPQGVTTRESDESRNLSGETPRIASLPRGDEVAHITIVATGPLTSPSMADALQALLAPDLGHGAISDAGTLSRSKWGQSPAAPKRPQSGTVPILPPCPQNRGHVPRRLFFYDAIAPIVSAESLDMTRVFEGSRYGAGSDYLNCPMTEGEYGRLVQALLEAELHPLHDFEASGHGAITDTGTRSESPEGIRSCPQNRGHVLLFEGCLPVEEIARRGRLALAFGPMKPVGLVDPRGHDPKSQEDFGHVPRRPFAVVQLRRENAEGTMYNLVGFQTRLKQSEQERVFRMIPGLEKAGFLRFGSIHRNTYLDSPKLLLPTLQMRHGPELLVAGQLTGVEGYVESIGAGLVAGINAARLVLGEQPLELPREMMLGSLLAYISASENRGQSPAAKTRPQSGTVPVFQPMNANFGLLPPLEKRLRGRDRRRALAERALEATRGFALTLAVGQA